MEIHWFHVNDKSFVRNLPIMHNLLGFAISMLLVFRTNTAYDRWWEGRKLWGSLVNNSRNLALKLSSILDKNDKSNRDFFQQVIPAFAQALHQHLRNEKTRLALFDHNPDHSLINSIDHDKHVPNQVACRLFERIHDLYRAGKIDGNQLIILNAEIQSFTDISGACERIKNTPIPYSYSVFIKKFIFIYIMTLPVGYVFSLSYYVVPVTAFIFYVLASLELIAEEIEDPFGGDDNDVPPEKITANISKHVAELL